jgi:hypothetical protein
MRGIRIENSHLKKIMVVFKSEENGLADCTALFLDRRVK